MEVNDMTATLMEKVNQAFDLSFYPKSGRYYHKPFEQNPVEIAVFLKLGGISLAG